MPLIKEHRLALAEDEVARAREQLIDTVSDFAEMLEPKKIMSEVWESAKDKGADMAEGAVDAVRKRPVVFGGILAAAAAWLARDPIKGAATKAYGAMTSSDKKQATEKKTAPAAPNPPTAKKPKPAPRRPTAARKGPPKKTMEK